jgi:hypothetical protein
MKSRAYLIMLIFFALQVSTSCNRRKVTKATLFFYDNANKIDSTVFIEKKILNIFNQFLLQKKQVNYKFPTVYFVKFYYNDNSIEEYDCNETLLRSNFVYTVQDSALKNEYLKIINSVLPLPLQVSKQGK